MRNLEVDAGKVRAGQDVAVTLDAIPDKTFSGRITNVSNIFSQASAERPVKVLQVKIAVENLDVRRVRPGMAARFQVTIDRFSDVLAVPLSVIALDNGKSYVWVKKKDGAEKRQVRLGKNNGIVAVIDSGLSEGEQVAGRPLGAGG